MMQGQLAEIGQRFLDYYQCQGFTLLARGSLCDPLLPMTFVGSAGLSQIEAAIEAGEDHAGERYVILQPCFRHFDMAKVSQSPCHLSLFEMAGAFNFGLFQKNETLLQIWEYLITEAELEKERLWVTYFTGGSLDGHGFEPDKESYETWQDIGVAPGQIIGVGIEKGFWKQGGGLSGRERFRKCGPTTEIFFDRGKQYRCGQECLPGCDCGRFIEIANVLFIHSRIDQTTFELTPLLTPFVEVVIGVERVTMARLNAASVFEIESLDAFTNLVRRTYPSNAEDLSARSSEIVTGTRIIVDALRALIFLLADGAPAPGKGGQRRIIRMLLRAVLMYQDLLKLSAEHYLSGLLETILQTYQHRYPELHYGVVRLSDCLKHERVAFDKTLSTGYRQLEALLASQRKDCINGIQLVQLVKRYGIPFPLLEYHLTQQGISINRHEYRHACMQWQQTL